MYVCVYVHVCMRVCACVHVHVQLSPEHRESDGIIEFYTVVYDTVNSTQSGGKQEQPVQVPRVNNITIATITGLTKGTEYEFRVKGSNGPYQTPLSSPLRVMTNSSG